ncbi:hypothetical protein EC957_001241 [Mortierella hygrophila]|uniref:Uncharacterized protein n=1 Tax=Mortierella hygrophila TaxID=979708 RepID=A0A9P6K208_9FUNG|nr:hypothetical protein EC957_001241 [Mortierella hygrophila]
MVTIDRDAMEQRIQNYLDRSTDTRTRGNLYILYERLGQFKWFPGKGDSKRRCESKHWKLVVIIGDDRVIIDFVENGDNTKRGIVILSDYDRYRGNSQLHFLGNITIDTEKLYSDIHDMFTEWTRSFLALFVEHGRSHL